MKTFLPRLQSWLRLISLLKYGILYGLVIAALPLVGNIPLVNLGFTKISNPAYIHITGIFQELSRFDIVLIGIILAMMIWSLMFTQALIVDSASIRFGASQKNRQKESNKGFRAIPAQPSGYIPAIPEQILDPALSWIQVFLYMTLAIPTIWVIVSQRDLGPEGSLLGGFGLALLGVCIGLGIMLTITLPSDYAAQTQKLFPKPLYDRLWGRVQKADWLVRPRRWLSWLARKLPGRYYFDDAKQGEPLITSNHFFALAMLGALLVIYFVVRFLFTPPSPPELPPLGHIYILVTLLIWIAMAFDYHLAIMRLSPLLLLTLMIGTLFLIRNSDYYFPIVHTDVALERVTPIDAVAKSKQQENLVVITSTGGGIVAAGWTTQAMEKMLNLRPTLAHEIRMISAVSGSSVGTAYYVNELLEEGLTSGECQPTADVLATVRTKSTESSLSAAAYGIAFIDFWPVIVGGRIFSQSDRGTVLENKWAYIGANNQKEKQPLMTDLVAGIHSGCLPVPIFNTTVMENGQRVMITPTTFSTDHLPASESMGNDQPPSLDSRSKTLSEYLFYYKDAEAPEENYDYRANNDIGLWTAARLSATFPYISPAAKADLKNTELHGDEFQETFLGHHFIDGGYYDDFGVASALDWLTPVLQAHGDESSGINFKRLLIVQLRSEPAESPLNQPSASGAASALIGPLLGIVNIREGVAFSRNETDLDRFMQAWESRLKVDSASGDNNSGDNNSVEIETLVLQPTATQLTEGGSSQNNRKVSELEVPVSWHLTTTQIETLGLSWGPALDACLREAVRFLDGEEHELSAGCADGSYAD